MTKKTTTQHRYSSPGFTLVEILAVLILITLMAGATTSILRNRYKRLAEKAATELFLAAKYARIIAIERQMPCKLYLDQDQPGFYLTTGSYEQQNGGYEEITINNQYHRPVILPEGITFEEINIKPIENYLLPTNQEDNVIAFAPNGTADAAVIQIGAGKRHYTLHISPATGRPTLTRGTATTDNTDIIDLDLQ